jgi:hypothetical protein
MKKSPLLSIAVRNGLIAGALSAIVLVGLYYMGRHPMMLPPYLDFRILIFGVFIFFTLKEFRETHQNGVLHFPQGIGGSFMFTIITATTASVMVWLFASVESDFLADYIKEGMALLKAYPKEEIERIGKEGFERNFEQLPSTNAKQLAAIYFTQSMVFGLFVSIILSVILRKQPKSL